MDERARKIERALKSSWDEQLFQAYIAYANRAGIQLCHCENSHCYGVHVYDPQYGPAPEVRDGELVIPRQTIENSGNVNVGYCLNPADPKVRVEYVRMCDECAQHLPPDWHLEDCECTKCGPKPTPQEQVAELMPTEYWSDEEPDPTEEGWWEDWEADEFT